jgi:hypothetical protein
MPAVIMDCEQNSPEWYAARAGLPTASEFHTVMAKGKAGEESKTRKTYLLKLAGEILTGEPMENYTNTHMERGKVMEEEARDCYAFMKDAEPQRVGFIRNGNTGCSPDSLIGASGLLEIKTKLPHLMIECLLRDEFPPEHKAQCQGALWVAEREWIDIAVYWPKLPLFVKRATRDDGYIANLAGAVAKFNDELAETVERIRRYGEPKPTARDQLIASVKASGFDPDILMAG